MLFTKDGHGKNARDTLKELQYCHSIRCAVIHGADRQLEHNEVVKCQNIWKNIFLEKELTDRQRHQFRLRYKDDGTCNAVLRERVGNPKLANAIYTHGLPWIMQSGAAGWVSGDDVLHRSLSEGVLWLKNVGQGLVERKKRVLYAEAQHLGGKRKNESSLEERNIDRKDALRHAKWRAKRGVELQNQRDTGEKQYDEMNEQEQQK